MDNSVEPIKMKLPLDTTSSSLLYDGYNIFWGKISDKYVLNVDFNKLLNV